MKRCPHCGTIITTVPKDASPFVKAIIKADRELSKLSPAEIARDMFPPGLPVALETANFITD